MEKNIQALYYAQLVSKFAKHLNPEQKGLCKSCGENGSRP